MSTFKFVCTSLGFVGKANSRGMTRSASPSRYEKKFKLPTSERHEFACSDDSDDFGSVTSGPLFKSLF